MQRAGARPHHLSYDRQEECVCGWVGGALPLPLCMTEVTGFQAVTCCTTGRIFLKAWVVGTQGHDDTGTRGHGETGTR